MNMSQLPYIIAIASTGSLSGASRVVGVSQPAVSKYLSELEHDIGLKLFEADGKKLRPTQAGRVYIQAAQDILNLAQRTTSSIASLGRSVERELRIGALPYSGAKVLAELFVEFNSRFPQIRLCPQESAFAELIQSLQRRETDFALVCQQSTLPDGIEYLPLFREELLLAVPLTYPMAPENPVYDLARLPYAELRDFASATFIQMEPGTPLYEVTRPLLQTISVHQQRFFSTTNGDTLAVLIRDGAGAGFLPASYCKPQSGLVFFRLQPPCYFSRGIMFLHGAAFQAAERCLLYLMLKRRADTCPDTILWNDFLRGIVRQFGSPLDPLTQCMEAADEH